MPEAWAVLSYVTAAILALYYALTTEGGLRRLIVGPRSRLPLVLAIALALFPYLFRHVRHVLVGEDARPRVESVTRGATKRLEGSSPALPQPESLGRAHLDQTQASNAGGPVAAQTTSPRAVQHRQSEAIRVVDRRRASVRFFRIPANGADARITSLGQGESLDELQQRTHAEMVVSPGLFDTASGNPVGPIAQDGELTGRRHSEFPGYFWSIKQDGLAVQAGPAVFPGDCQAGACGPAYVLGGRVMTDLASQHFTSAGGQFGRHRRIALAIDQQGKLLVAVSEGEMDPIQFAESLVAEGHVETAVGLSGGEHLALYADGTWYAKPREPLPYVLVFGSR